MSKDTPVQNTSAQDTAQWDFARFVTTLNTFGELPFLGSFRWLQAWMGQRQARPGENLQAMNKRVAVIGTIPSGVTATLKQMDPAIKLTSYEGAVPTYQFSLEEKHQLCKLTKSAETVLVWNASNFSNLMAALGECLDKNSETVAQTVFDFAKQDSDLSAWGALDDVVMGGISEGAFLPSSEGALTCALFTGNVSTRNSGGFSSVRSQNFEPPYRFPGWDGLRLKVKGDGQRYKFILRNSAGWDSPGYIYGFDTVADQWIEINIPFQEMVPTFRAKSMPNAPAFNPAEVVSFQLMLSKFEYDKRLNPLFNPGPFKLAIADISVYKARKGTPLVVIADSEETTKQVQQAALTESGIHYRFIEPSPEMNEERLAEAINAALS